jgi:hypothetical protein
MLWLKENKLSSTYIRQWIVDREREKKAEEGKNSLDVRLQINQI